MNMDVSGILDKLMDQNYSVIKDEIYNSDPILTKHFEKMENLSNWKL